MKLAERDKKIVAGIALGLLAFFSIIKLTEAKEEVSAEILYASIEEEEGG